MNIKNVLTLMGMVALGAPLSASVAFTLNVGGFRDASGEATDGMNYAIVIDTENDGFDAGFYSPFEVTENEQYLSLADGTSDDFYVFSSNGIASTVSAPPLGGSGAIGSITNVPFDHSKITADDAFGVIWFDSNRAEAGDHYGFLSSISWAVPSDGGAFSNSDMVIPGSAVLSITAVPEAETYSAFMALFALACFFYKRTRV